MGPFSAYGAFLSAAYSLRHRGRHLTKLSRTQWLRPKEIRAIQLKKLRAMLKHCYGTVPFYHRVMKENNIFPEDIRSLDDLSCLPVVDKAEINRAPGEFRSQRATRKILVESTSGSTGEPFSFPRAFGTYEWELAASLRFKEWTGYRLGDRWCRIHGIKGLRTFMQKLTEAAKDVLLRRLRVNCWKVSEEDMREEADRIASHRPFLVESIPRVLLDFGRLVQKKDVEVPVVVSSMEMLAPFERRAIAERWGGEVYDMYGSAEARSVSSECPEHYGLHVADELYLLEFVKDNEPVSPGEMGRIVVTSLCHWVQPFIRYDTGDLSMPLDEVCACGRGLSLMSPVEGRCHDVLETEDGRLIFGHRFTDWFGDTRVRQYQVEQFGRERTVVRIVPEEGYGDELGEDIAANVRAVLGTGVEVEIEVLDAIPDYQSGKRQIVKSRARFL